MTDARKAAKNLLSRVNANPFRSQDEDIDLIERALNDFRDTAVIGRIEDLMVEARIEARDAIAAYLVNIADVKRPGYVRQAAIYHNVAQEIRAMTPQQLRKEK